MTTQESFKRRIRARMAKTGEKYGAARRALIEAAQRPAEAGGRTRAAEPEAGDDAVLAATSRSWDQWCDLIEAWPGHVDGHTAVAAHLVENHDIDGWWAQQVTGGWERITGRRLPGQMADGTFTANKSKTLAIDAALLRELLLDDDGRADLLGMGDTQVRSKPTSKTVRIAMPEGTALVDLTARDDGRTTIAVQHEKLPTPGHVTAWKQHWAAWFDDLHRVLVEENG